MGTKAAFLLKFFTHEEKASNIATRKMSNIFSSFIVNYKQGLVVSYKLVDRTSIVLLLCSKTFSAADILTVRMLRIGSRLVLGAYTCLSS